MKIQKSIEYIVKSNINIGDENYECKYYLFLSRQKVQ